MDLSHKSMRTQVCENKTLGNSHFELITQTNDNAERVGALKDAINATFGEASYLESVSAFEKRSTKLNEIFHVRAYDQPEIRQIHFSSSEVYTATVKLSGNSSQRKVVIAFDNEKYAVYAKIVDCEKQALDRYGTLEALYIFNQNLRLSDEIIPHTGNADTGAKDINNKPIIIKAELVSARFSYLASFITDKGKAMKERMRSTPLIVKDETEFKRESYHCTLFYLRNLTPIVRYMRSNAKDNGDFNMDKSVRPLQHLIQCIGRVYYARDCLVSIAAAFCRELAPLNGLTAYGEERATNDLYKAVILGVIEENVKEKISENEALLGYKAIILGVIEEKISEIEALLGVVSMLADFVGYLFRTISERDRTKVIAQKAVASMYVYNIAFTDAASASKRSLFGHLLTLRLLEKTRVGIVSKYNNPLTQKKQVDVRKTKDIHTLEDATCNENVVLIRVKHVHTNSYAHSMGYTWKNRIRAVIRKKGLIHLNSFINKQVYDELNLFKTYNIHNEFQGIFPVRRDDIKDFAHNISITCDAETVMELTLNSTCKKLSGVTLNHTVNTL
jgi:hypothetical protein